MEDIDGGLHPAVNGQSLHEDEVFFCPWWCWVYLLLLLLLLVCRFEFMCRMFYLHLSCLLDLS